LRVQWCPSVGLEGGIFCSTKRSRRNTTLVNNINNKEEEEEWSKGMPLTGSNGSINLFPSISFLT
ncbi:hypothetical protein AMTR_s03610p00004760, partial [Amborella trichopoda]